MKITLLLMGRTSDLHCAALLERYIKRVRHYVDCSVVEIPEIKTATASGDILKEKEFSLQQKYLSKSDHIILLDEAGKQFSSRQFASFIMLKQSENRKHIVFITGGAYGFSDGLYTMAHEKISISAMTFPHQLVRVFFAEQLYRAFTILNNGQYHH